MPSRKTRKAPPHRTILAVCELEGREVPAWFSVALPTPVGGTAGNTMATHSGELSFSPSVTPIDGKAYIFADTATDALTKAFVGTLSVTIAGDTTDYPFDDANIGTDVAEHKAFLVTETNNEITLSFEDMAGLPDCDYDYNDRDWPVIDFDPELGDVMFFRNTHSFGGGAFGADSGEVEVTVTSQADGKYLWKYVVSNDTYGEMTGYGGEDTGIGIFHLQFPTSDVEMFNIENSMGWEFISEWLGETGQPGWMSLDQDVEATIEMGETGEFSFETEPLPIVESWLEVSDPGYASGGGGKAEVPGVALAVSVRQVAFSAASGMTVRNDPGESFYDLNPVNLGTQYIDDDGKGISAGDRQQPVVFVRNEVIKVSAKIAVDKGTLPENNIVEVRADGPGNYDTPWVKAPVVDGFIQFPETALNTRAPNNVDWLSTFSLKWEVDTKLAGSKVANAGISTNEMFVTLAESDSNLSMYVTPLWLFCKSAKGSTDIDTAINKAFSPYESLNVKTHPEINPLYNDPTEPLYYYNNWLTGNTSFEQMMTPLVVNGKVRVKDGQCGAWVDLLQRTLVEGGIPSNMVIRSGFRAKIEIPNAELMIDRWEFTGTGTSGNPVFPYENNYHNTPFTYDNDGIARGFKWQTKSEAKDLQGKSGQNNTNPNSIFRIHLVIRIGNYIYDPSYGARYTSSSGWDTNCLLWEISSVAGIVIKQSSPTLSRIISAPAAGFPERLTVDFVQPW